MPRLDSAASGAGIHVPGAYVALLDYERERNERSDRIAAEMMAADGCCFHRDRGLADLLEAGQPVMVSRGSVESALWLLDRPPRRVRLPLDRAVRFVQVSRDDRVRLAADLEWHGAVAEGLTASTNGGDDDRGSNSVEFDT